MGSSGELKSDRDADALVPSERVFQSLIESAPDAILTIDRDGRIVMANERAEEMFGYARSELIHRPVELLVPESLRGAHAKRRTTYTEMPEIRPMGAGLELKALRRDGSELPVEISLSPLQIDEEFLVISVVRDISDRKRLEEAERDRVHAQSQFEKQRAKARMHREVLRRSIAAQEEERRRIARELHDETGQALTGVILGLGRIKSSVGTVGVSAEIDRLREQVVQAINELRNLAMRLRPTALDDLGLVPAIERLTEEAALSGGARVSFNHIGLTNRLDSDLETAIYRVMQEALTNALKYSRANEITLDIVASRDTLIAKVIDNGCGFDPDAVTDGALGIAGMKERADLVGGRIDVESELGKGTAVTISIPLELVSL